ncbi:DinB family protein [Botrimarina hoheduenensis]|uniref:DinB superfamily protein n=1 Tax=Botrimarina hoheduenensis TaxID=2528000 RepID=A0A5C5VX25_9BACT|nr:DinB family protein [Botrimarina hoheduenensis]TWT42950.1 DinB superfamily protein [Botrimarina hoheduenensis]
MALADNGAVAVGCFLQTHSVRFRDTEAKQDKVAVDPFAPSLSIRQPPMNTELLTLYRFTLAMAESLMIDISEEEMAHQPAPGVNPPAWIIGHLAVVNEMALALMGHEKRLPAAWTIEFGPGSQPLPQQMEAYPPRAELLTALRETHAAVCLAVQDKDLGAMSAANPITPLAKSLPTQGDLLAHILTTHPASHLGHLSNWRRQRGRAPLF